MRKGVNHFDLRPVMTGEMFQKMVSQKPGKLVEVSIVPIFQESFGGYCRYSKCIKMHRYCGVTHIRVSCKCDPVDLPILFLATSRTLKAAPGNQSYQLWLGCDLPPMLSVRTCDPKSTMGAQPSLAEKNTNIYMSILPMQKKWKQDETIVCRRPNLWWCFNMCVNMC